MTKPVSHTSRWVRHARSSRMKDTGHSQTYKAASAQDNQVQITGLAYAHRVSGRSRLAFAMVCFATVFATIGLRLADLAGQTPTLPAFVMTAQDSISAARPDIIDRNGELMATDVTSVAVYAEPRKMRDVDIDQAVAELLDIMPDLDGEVLYKRMRSDQAFAFVMREITPRQREQIRALGIPGIGFLNEARRFYPGGPLAAHVLGHVNVDNQGIAGIEAHIDRGGLSDLQSFGFATTQAAVTAPVSPDDTVSAMQPVRLTLDTRIQHAMRDELLESLERYRAKAAMGVLMDVRTGEIVSMVSVPDYDPNKPSGSLNPEAINRVSAGVFELGSIFKAITAAAALDSGRVSLEDSFDARKPIRVGNRTIDDFHAKRRILSVPEVFIYSSNIGTAKMALTLGLDGQQDYMRRLGLLERPEFELPEVARPLLPREWNELAAMTISFGHGLSVSPLQVAAATAALVNGGSYIPPTLYPRTAVDAQMLARPVIKPETSAAVRSLMRLNVLEGSGRSADVDGLDVGGKTGTAEKVVDGAYSG